MAKNSATPTQPAPRAHLVVSPDDVVKKLTERYVTGNELLRRRISSQDQLDTAWTDYRRWDSYNTELLLTLFTTSRFSDEYSHEGIGSFHMSPPSFDELVDDFRDDVKERIHRLVSVCERVELVPHKVDDPLSPGSPGGDRGSDKVFVVHGHDEAARESVARFVERVGLDAVILHEQATAGRTVVEKLERYADVGFAVVLLTPDDTGGVRGTDITRLEPRARQNVVLELGYFLGKLGRGRVCALHKGPLELPSDILGVVYVPLDERGAWKLLLARELRAAGFTVDMNRIV